MGDRLLYDPDIGNLMYDPISGEILYEGPDPAMVLDPTSLTVFSYIGGGVGSVTKVVNISNPIHSSYLKWAIEIDCDPGLTVTVDQSVYTGNGLAGGDNLDVTFTILTPATQGIRTARLRFHDDLHGLEQTITLTDKAVAIWMGNINGLLTRTPEIHDTAGGVECAYHNAYENAYAGKVWTPVKHNEAGYNYWTGTFGGAAPETITVWFNYTLEAWAWWYTHRNMFGDPTDGVWIGGKNPPTEGSVVEFVPDDIDQWGRPTFTISHPLSGQYLCNDVTIELTVNMASETPP